MGIEVLLTNAQETLAKDLTTFGKIPLFIPYS